MGENGIVKSMGTSQSLVQTRPPKRAFLKFSVHLLAWVLVFLVFQLIPDSALVGSESGAYISVQYGKIIGKGPPAYGVNIWWTDQDASQWRQLNIGLHPKTIRLAMPHAVLEPVNDDGDPKHIHWEGFLFDKPIGIESQRSVTFKILMEELRDQNVEVMIHFPYLAPWLSDNPSHSGDLAPYPPNDLQEYREFIEAVLIFLVDQVGFPQERLLLEAMNEPDLKCGQDPVVDCFWQNWIMQDIRDVVRVTGEAIQKIAPEVRLVGLSECCSVDIVTNLMDNYPEGKLLDGLSYHYYDPSDFNLGPALYRAEQLSVYDLPIYLDEYGSFNHLSEGKHGGLWHSRALPILWKAEISPLQYAAGEWPLLGEPYNSMGLFKDWRGNWEQKPSYWVYRNFYSHFESSRIVESSHSSGLEVLASRKNDNRGLSIWVTNPTGQSFDNLQFNINGYGPEPAYVSVYDNFEEISPVERLSLSGSPLRFAYSIPARSSYSFVIHDVTARMYLPFLQIR
jgi:hypothetical protein